MFDHVGCNPDEETRKRQALSFLVTTGGLGALCAGFIAASAWLVQESLELLESDEEMVEVVLLDEAAVALPSLPPPPPRSTVSPDEVDEVDVIEPDELMDEVVKLIARIDPRMARDVRPDGVEGGREGGVEDGVEDGVVWGSDGGGLGHRLGHPRVVHHTELEVKRSPPLRYPETARSMGLGEQVCKARVFIDERGIPYHVVVEDCPRIFHAETQRGILQWRWMPPRSGRVRHKAQTMIAVRYVLSD